MNNWPYFNNIKAISPSSISKLLAYMEYGKVNKKQMQYAFNRGNEIEEGFYTYHKYKKLNIDSKKCYAFALSKCKSTFKRKQLIKLIYWFDKKYPSATLETYQRIAFKEPYACILDFEFNYLGKVLIFDLKTNNKRYSSPLQRIMWDIQFYIQSLCTNNEISYIWCSPDKEKDITIESKKWKYPIYDLRALIELLQCINMIIDWDNEEIVNNHVENIKDYFKLNNIKWEREKKNGI